MTWVLPLAVSPEMPKGNLVRTSARWLGLAIGLFVFLPSARSCFTLRNQDLPEGEWALLAPLLLLPLIAISVALPRIGAVLIILLAALSAAATGLWIARLGWLPGLGELLLVLALIGALGVAVLWSSREQAPYNSE
jgi:hypothetical protein